jgi:hypothetical protein
MMTELFQQPLHINAPWLIKSIDFNAEDKRLDIQSSRFILGTRACK